MTTATRHGVGAAVAPVIRESPMSTVVAPAALIGLAVWLLASTPAWWIGPVGVVAGGRGLGLGLGLGGVVVDAVGYRIPLWW